MLIPRISEHKREPVKRNPQLLQPLKPLQQSQRLNADLVFVGQRSIHVVRSLPVDFEMAEVREPDWADHAVELDELGHRCDAKFGMLVAFGESFVLERGRDLNETTGEEGQLVVGGAGKVNPGLDGGGESGYFLELLVLVQESFTN